MGISDHLGLLQAFCRAFCRQRNAGVISGGLASVGSALTMAYQSDVFHGLSFPGSRNAGMAARGIVRARGRDREKRSEQGAHAYHPLYTEAVEALKLYLQAHADGVAGAELERLKLMAEHRFQAVTDYQLRALGGPAEQGHQHLTFRASRVLSKGWIRKHAGDDPGIKKSMMRQLFSIVCRKQCGRISRTISDISRPAPSVVSELAKQLPVIDRCVCDYLELFVISCQEP